MRRVALATAVLAGVVPLWTAPAGTARAESIKTCAGVWVVVDFGRLGGVEKRCATSFGNGTNALRSAGFSPTLDNGMITKIAGLPESPDLNQEYWSYWQATAKSDGSFSAWAYSNLGANASHPAKGNAEGWRYQGLSDGKVPPSAQPPTGEAAKPSPSPSKTTTKPTTTPSPTKTASATPTVSKSPSATASPTPTPSATSVPASPSPAAIATPISAPVPEPASGSPMGLLVTGGILTAAAVGFGGWWWLKGRQR